MLLLSLALAAALNGPAAAQGTNPFAAPAAWDGVTFGVPSDPAQEARMPRVTAQRLHSLQQKIKGLIIVDARNPADYQESHVAGAVNVPLAQFSTLYKELPKDHLIALYCT